MKVERFDDLPDESSLWIYGFAMELKDPSKRELRGRLANFIAGWETHGEPVLGSFEIVGDRFVVLAGHCPGGISGCSVDASIRVFKELRDAGLDGLDRSYIYYRNRNGAIESIHFSKFQAELDAGRVDGRSKVFDTNLTQLGQLRTLGLEKPLAESWHARAFSVPRESH